MLEKEYGDPYKVSTTYMQKLSSWPNLRYDDGSALKCLSIFVNTCNNAMKTIQHLAVLNHPTNMQTIVQKLPAGLSTVAGFGELVEFLEYKAETANDPVYSKEALNKAKPRTNAPVEEKKLTPPASPPTWNLLLGPHVLMGLGFQAKALKRIYVPCAEIHLIWKTVMSTGKSPWKKGGPF